MSEESGTGERDDRQRRYTPNATSGELEKSSKENVREDAPRTGDESARFPLSYSCILGLLDLGNILLDRFDKLGHVQDLKNSTRCHWLAMHLAPDTGPAKPFLLTSLGGLYVRRFKHFSELDAINKAIGCQSRALLLTPAADERRLSLLHDLGTSYLRRFKFQGKVTDVDRAIDCQIEAVHLTPDGHAAKPVRLSHLGISYMRRFEYHGDITDASRSIECLTQAVRAVPDGHVDKPAWLSSLGNAYMRRLSDHGDATDADQAIKYHLKAVQLTPVGDPEKPLRLNNLGGSHMRRFDRHGDTEDLSKSIRWQMEAVRLIPDGHEEMPGMLYNLGFCYRRRFDHHGDVADIDQAIVFQKESIRLTPHGHAWKPSALNDLGASYSRRFRHHGDIVDVDKAIECQMDALQLTRDSHPERADILSSLGSSYEYRFDRLKDVADINQAIKYQVEALRLTPECYVRRSDRLEALGISYRRRFERGGSLSDVDRSIECHIQALELTPHDHAGRALSLGNLGASYGRRYESHRDIADFNKAIECQLEAVRLGPDDHARKSGLFNNLGTTYMRRFHREGRIEDLDKAIEYYMQAVQLIPDGHADQPALLDGLGSSYLNRFKHSSQTLDLEAANTAFKKAAQSNTGDLVIRFATSRRWARLSAELGVSPELAYRRAMELVSQLVWLGTTVKRRYDLLLEIGNVSVEAASWAVKFKKYECALEWLEQGRSIVWNQILQLRTPLDDLYAVNSALAEQLKDLARRLEQAGSRIEPSEPTNSEWGPEKQAQQHRRLAAKWAQLLTQAREIPGFEDFLQTRTAAQLMRAAKDGPLIVVIVHQDRSDALIIQPNNANIGHVPLNSFSQPTAVDLHVQLMSWIGHRGSRNGGFQRKKPMDNCHALKLTLATLWLEVVKPIFDFLGYTRKLSIEELPHVTWCTTGALSFFPLHAAGCYDGSELNAMDLAISSYTPTISALLAPSRLAPLSSSGILAVGQQFTKGQCSLPYTVQELDVIKEQAGRVGYLQLDGNNATVAAVLSAMEEYDWVHLACHASQHKENPAQSAFHLHDGALMLSMITQRSFKNKGLAFLSACQTATGDEKLPDEAVHLAAGMLMAGYPSVIATMWSIHDEDAPEVSRQVYADLLKDGRMDCTNAARALHKAVERLREKVGVSSFERWLPFIHIGL